MFQYLTRVMKTTWVPVYLVGNLGGTSDTAVLDGCASIALHDGFSPFIIRRRAFIGSVEGEIGRYGETSSNGRMGE